MINDEFDVIDYEAGADPNLRGQECQSCMRLLTYKFFRKDSSRKSGHSPQCLKCEQAPRLSMSEHTARLRQINFNSEGTKRQRHEDQREMRKNRRGKEMGADLFLQKLHHVCYNLYVTQGGIVGDLALYVTSGKPQPEWGGRDFKYLGYVTLGTMPEFSEYEFDEQRDVMIRTSKIGWRSVLLRFIENKILTEDQCKEEFGPPSSGISETWHKRLFNLRNNIK